MERAIYEALANPWVFYGGLWRGLFSRLDREDWKTLFQDQYPGGRHAVGTWLPAYALVWFMKRRLVRPMWSWQIWKLVCVRSRLFDLVMYVREPLRWTATAFLLSTFTLPLLVISPILLWARLVPSITLQWLSQWAAFIVAAVLGLVYGLTLYWLGIFCAYFFLTAFLVTVWMVVWMVAFTGKKDWRESRYQVAEDLAEFGVTSRTNILYAKRHSTIDMENPMKMKEMPSIARGAETPGTSTASSLEETAIPSVRERWRLVFLAVMYNILIYTTGILYAWSFLLSLLAASLFPFGVFLLAALVVPGLVWWVVCFAVFLVLLLLIGVFGIIAVVLGHAIASVGIMLVVTTDALAPFQGRYEKVDEANRI